jgi:hypothetical protein
MRAFFLCLSLLVLCGCESITRLDSDSFEVGRTGYETFEADAQDCQLAAEAPLGGDVRLVDATSYARNRAFNHLYARCMTARGHAPRPYLKNVLPGGGGL